MSQTDSDSSTKKTDPGSLDAFITSKRPHPEPIAFSQEVRDRGSIFIAHMYRATTPDEARARMMHLKHVVHRSRKATHEVSAWRCMVLKPGRTGLEGPDDFELKQGSRDDGESWAGGKILKVMQNLAVIDAVVVVSRWYGGTMLGPARFSHIETCAAEVCRMFKRTEELQDYITTLRSLDDILAQLRKQLAALSLASVPPSTSTTEPTSSPAAAAAEPGAGAESTSDVPAFRTYLAKKPDYTALDVAKAKRLIQARESSIKSVRALIAKKKSDQS